MCVCVCACVCVRGVPVGDGESVMAVKSLGQGTVAGLGGDVVVWTGVRWKVAACNGNRGPDVVPIGKMK